ncbi:hypothetical protein EMCRGX_G011344 [Ephydatia muelleri]
MVCPDKQVRKFVKSYCRGAFTARNSSTAAFVRLIVLKTLQLYVPKELEKSILQQIAEINSQHTEAAKATLRTQFGLNEAY